MEYSIYNASDISGDCNFGVHGGIIYYRIEKARQGLSGLWQNMLEVKKSRIEAETSP